MRNHFNKYLNIREMILTYKPESILELGAYKGENTLQVWKLREQYPFRMVTISDNPETFCYQEVIEAKKNPDYKYIQGISYKEIPKLNGNVFDMVLIDTDHNYYTLKLELEALYPKLVTPCLIVCHDTVSCLEKDHQTVFEQYATGEEYPKEEVINQIRLGKTMNDAISEFMQEHTEWTILRATQESCGCVALSRGL